MADQAGIQKKPVEPDTLPQGATNATNSRSRILSRHRVIELAEAYALVVLTIGMAIFFTVYGPTADLFPTSENLKVLAAQQGVLAVVALAALIPLIADEWDLSVGANAGLAAIFVASAMSKGTSIPVAVALGIGLGLAVGVFNGLIVTRLRINAVIPTLGTATIITGIITAKTGGLSIVSNIPSGVTKFGSGDVLSIPYIVIAMAVLAGVVYYLLEYTPFGRHIYAIGSNRPAAKLVGINNGRIIFLSFVAAGFLCGLAGSLQVARSSGVSPEVGEQLTLPALAAAFLSAASIRPGRYNVGGVLVAIFFLAVLNNGLNLAGAPNYINDLVNGLALIIGVGFGAVLGRRRMTSGA
ncbi:MAG: ABC transporter permease [Solirubrobacterales bacterium]